MKTKDGILIIPDTLFLSGTTLPCILFPHKGVLNSFNGYDGCLALWYGLAKITLG